jgi:hypothetical protein
VLRKEPCGRQTDAVSAARHDRRLACEIPLHFLMVDGSEPLLYSGKRARR